MSTPIDMSGAAGNTRGLAHGRDPAALEGGPTELPADVAAEFALARGFAERLGHLARLRGVDSHTIAWVEAAAFAISRATAEGHVCVSLLSLTQTGLARERGQGKLGVRPLRALLLASGLVCDGRAPDAALAPLVLDAGDRLYLARYYAYERQLARALVARVPAQFATVQARPGMAQHQAEAQVEPLTAALTQQLATSFGAPHVDQIDWQRVAAGLALSGRLTVISGGPGTGKTSTVVAILASLLTQAVHAGQPLPRIALAAPTGKAAQRMQEALQERAGALPPDLAAALPRHAYTLHRLLGVGPDGRFRHHRDAPLAYDVVVVDEASMIDVALAARLIDAVPAHSRLILLGDKDQLAAVEAGAVFAELSAHPQLSAGCIATLPAVLGLSRDQVEALVPASRRRDERSGGTHAVLSDCVVWLERNYRFGLSSPIGRLSLAIREGAASEALAVLAQHPAAAALYEDGEVRLSDAAMARLAAGFTPYAQALASWLAARAQHAPPSPPVLDSSASASADTGYAVAEVGADPGMLFDALNRYRVLCATRGGARGVIALNRRLAAQIRRDAHQSPAAGGIGGSTALATAGATAALAEPLGADAWYPGRPVMVTRNDYAMGLFNGDIGITLPGAQGLRVVFRQPGGGYRWLSPATLPQHETAFAMTVHKSQGSEFVEAAVVLPASVNRVLTRELVYTAVTRARERVVLYASSTVLAQGIVQRTERDSGLAARLAEALEG